MRSTHPAPRVLFADNLRRFYSRMDRNYRSKYDRVLVDRPGITITPVDTSFGRPHGIDVGDHDILLVGVFAALRDTTDPASSGVPPTWFDRFSKRCVMVEDTRDQERLAALMNDHGCQYLLATYYGVELTQLAVQCRHLRGTWVIPHHIDTTLYRDLGLEKRYDVLLYGYAEGWIYPFRSRLRGLLARSPLNVKIVDHPGRDQYDPARCGEGLVRLINESWLAIATPTSSDYLVAKYLEIAACGSVVAGKMASEGRPLWDGHYVALEEDMSDAEILQRLMAALEHKDRLKRDGATMRERIGRERSLDLYGPRFDAVMVAIAADDLRVRSSRPCAGAGLYCGQ
jgi:hypothetical protein